MRNKRAKKMHSHPVGKKQFPFSLIRTMTVGFAIAANLLTHTLKRIWRSRALRKKLPSYRRWGITPRPENNAGPQKRRPGA